MVATGIRDKIDAALRMESDTRQLSKRLEQELPQLHFKLVMPDNGPVAGLMEFITDYVSSVPGCLQLVTAVSKSLGFYDYAEPFLSKAQDYFLHPPADLPQDGGLEALLDEAFLAHRLLEEVNDHHIRHLQRPLLPVDMTEANIIVHHLLGDKLANRLDQLVHETASQLLQREYVWTRVRSLPGNEMQDNTTPGHEPVAAIPASPNELTRSPRQVRLRLANQAPGF